MQDSSHQLLLCFMMPPPLSNAGGGSAGQLRGKPREERSRSQTLVGRVGQLLLLDHEDGVVLFHLIGPARSRAEPPQHRWTSHSAKPK